MKKSFDFWNHWQDGSYLADLLISKNMRSMGLLEDLHHLILLELIIYIKILMIKIEN